MVWSITCYQFEGKVCHSESRGTRTGEKRGRGDSSQKFPAPCSPSGVGRDEKDLKGWKSRAEQQLGDRQDGSIPTITKFRTVVARLRKMR